MIEHEDTFAKWMVTAARDHIEAERAWLPHDRRGRWLVMEPGAGRYLTDSPKHVRDRVDDASFRRARRFSSLSRARAFARSVGGTVHHWRRRPPGPRPPKGKRYWGSQSPWDRARMSVHAMQRLPGMLHAMLDGEI